MWELIVDQETVGGRLASSGVVLGVALVLSMVGGRLAASRVDDSYARYYARKLVRYAVAAVATVIVAIVWRAFAGRAGVVLGLGDAGLAFAMQEVVGAVAGCFNIMSGRIFRVGDRIQMSGVQGDVIDITSLRTKIMEIGSPAESADTWVRGRQFTGRIVAVSNKAPSPSRCNFFGRVRSPELRSSPGSTPVPPTIGWSCRPTSWSRSGPPVRPRTT